MRALNSKSNKFPMKVVEISYQMQNRSNEILGGWQGWECIGFGFGAFVTAFRQCIKSVRLAKLTVALDGGEEFVFGVFDASRCFTSRSMSLLFVILVMSKSLELGGFSMSTPSTLHCYGNGEQHLLQSDNYAYHSGCPHYKMVVSQMDVTGSCSIWKTSSKAAWFVFTGIHVHKDFDEAIDFLFFRWCCGLTIR